MEEAVAPLVNSLNAPFWRAASEGAFVLPFCVSTERAFWPPSPLSPFASGGAVTWRPVAPVGRVKALVIYRRSFLDAFHGALPYGIALVELDAGPRLMAHVADPARPGAVARGDAVKLRHETRDGKRLLLAEPLR